VATVGDYFALLKPRVMSLVIFTAFAGIVVAPGEIHPLTAFTALLCIAIAAGASGALNMAYDSDIDALMSRTANRPIPSGHVTRGEALGFGWTLAVGAVTVMGLLVNAFAGALLAFTIFVYVGIYTLWLKRRTPQNIVIGGLAGALPPAIGWASVTGSLSLAPVVLVAIIFLWTPPHFWALSLYRKHEYARAGVPMLPVTHGDRFTRLHVLLYTIILSAICLLPFATGMSGTIYLVSALALNGMFLTYAARLYVNYSDGLARRTFRYSIVYLSCLFAALLIDHYGRLG
jgi:protoheme IX farnesyltransferase